jgi:transcriptional regulator with AAA-type ATPase domain
MLGEDSDFNTPLIGIRDPQTSVNFDFISKILIVGDSGVGKSQLFRRYLHYYYYHILHLLISFSGLLMKSSLKCMKQLNL